MKKVCIVLFFVACSSRAAFGQLVNPTVIHQDTDIALHHTDVYYAPLAPPDSTDTRGLLSAISTQLLNPDGLPDYYHPMFHGHVLDSFKYCDTCPILGNLTVWMRLFTANDKPSGAHSDIIVGDTTRADSDYVYVDSLEDVDFRATGTIRMEAGFHVKPGAFFHAYIAPQFDTLVFSDEFNDTATFRDQWFVPDNAWDANTVHGSECSYDSNYAIMPDPDAEDGWALRLDLKLNPDTCHCYQKVWVQDSCTEHPYSDSIYNFQFSTVDLMSCPFGYRVDSAGLLRWAYANAPYGKYEVREKIPRVIHHTNFWGDGITGEWDASEKLNWNMVQIVSGYSHKFLYGPFKGWFGKRDTTPIFQSPAAHFTNWNNPYYIVINNFAYQVSINIGTTSIPRDTFLTAYATTLNGEGGFPASLVADSTDTVTFYYRKNTNNVADSLAWSVSGRYFSFPSRDSAAYGINGDTLFFNKGYQPVDISLLDSNLFPSAPITYSCHWDHSTGKIYLNDTLGDTVNHTGVGFSYDVDEGPDYPVPDYLIDSDYHYHTYTMEWFPHEMHILYDGAVIRRYPDRLIPVGDKRYDFATTYPRSPMSIRPGEIDINGSPSDTSSNSTYETEKRYFEANVATCSGCWDGAAHHMLDYVKVWDLPVGYKLPEYPH